MGREIQTVKCGADERRRRLIVAPTILKQLIANIVILRMNTRRWRESQ